MKIAADELFNLQKGLLTQIRRNILGNEHLWVVNEESGRNAQMVGYWLLEMVIKVSNKTPHG